MDDVELALFERQVEALEAIAERLRECLEVLETLVPAPPRPGRGTIGNAEGDNQGGKR